GGLAGQSCGGVVLALVVLVRRAAQVVAGELHHVANVVERLLHICDAGQRCTLGGAIPAGPGNVLAGGVRLGRLGLNRVGVDGESTLEIAHQARIRHQIWHGDSPFKLVPNTVCCPTLQSTDRRTYCNGHRVIVKKESSPPSWAGAHVAVIAVSVALEPAFHTAVPHRRHRNHAAPSPPPGHHPRRHHPSPTAAPPAPRRPTNWPPRWPAPTSRRAAPHRPGPPRYHRRHRPNHP